MGMDEIDKLIELIVESNAPIPSPLSEVDEEFLNDFIIETKEHVEKIEVAALDLETTGVQLEGLHALFREFHTIKGLAGFVDQLLIQNLAHETETLLDFCRKGKIDVEKSMIDAILVSADFIKKICFDIALNSDIVFCKTVLAHQSFLATLIQSEINPLRDLDIKQSPEQSMLAFEQVIESMNDMVAAPNNTSDSHASDDGVIRIQVQKIDNLVEMVGELIINQSLIDQKCAERFDNNDNLSEQVRRVSHIIKDLQNLSLSMRMVSLKSTFQKLRRIGRDCIAETRKNVAIRFIGEETEIDRSVADKLLDPLVHIIKNSISHGIEAEGVRIQSGKPIQGTITVKAQSKKGSVSISISDDGGGMCTDIICKKAMEKGLIDANTTYSKEEIRDLIFAPGFSTAQKIDNISGRGVGMDVVKTEISKIGGKAELVCESDNTKKFLFNQVCPCEEDECYCHKGKGLKIKLKIPINMAIMNGTIIDINHTKYILPTLQVKKIFKPEPSQWVSVKGSRNMITMRDEILSVIQVAEVFELEDFSLDNCIIVVLEHEQQLRALPVSNIVDKREIVVKSLGEVFKNLQYAAGASILGDGKVAIILDIEHLFKKEEGK
ncbi:MAG: chemotaxis protein CheW [Hyphomonadaceae bacterium]|nr:chemotaxis protein CheW [Clostridia bacterium]